MGHLATCWHGTGAALFPRVRSCVRGIDRPGDTVLGDHLSCCRSSSLSCVVSSTIRAQPDIELYFDISYPLPSLILTLCYHLLVVWNRSVCIWHIAVLYSFVDGSFSLVKAQRVTDLPFSQKEVTLETVSLAPYLPFHSFSCCDCATNSSVICVPMLKLCWHPGSRPLRPQIAPVTIFSSPFMKSFRANTKRNYLCALEYSSCLCRWAGAFVCAGCFGVTDTYCDARNAETCNMDTGDNRAESKWSFRKIDWGVLPLISGGSLVYLKRRGVGTCWWTGLHKVKLQEHLYIPSLFVFLLVHVITPNPNPFVCIFHLIILSLWIKLEFISMNNLF